MRLVAFALLPIMVFASASWAAAPTPFSTFFQRASTVLVGATESWKRISVSDPRAVSKPLEAVEYAPVFPCELGIRVAAVIKTATPSVKSGAVVQVVSYLPASQCTPNLKGQTPSDGAALWLLRTEGDFLRTLVDNVNSVRPIGMLSSEAAQRLASWTDPKLAMTYLALKPGILITEKGYARSSLPADVVAISGFRDFLKVYRQVYLESNGFERDQIHFIVASFAG